MDELLVNLDRLTKLAEILVEMSKEYDYKKFCAIDKKFKDEMMIYKLENALNERCDHEQGV
jgi:hypothetical protein